LIANVGPFVVRPSVRGHISKTKQGRRMVIWNTVGTADSVGEFRTSQAPLGHDHPFWGKHGCRPVFLSHWRHSCL